MNEDKSPIDKLEGFQAKTIVAFWGRINYCCVVNGAADKRNKKSGMVIFSTRYYFRNAYVVRLELQYR